MLEGWGEGLDDEAGLEEGLDDWVVRHEAKTDKLKDLERIFRMEMANKYVEEPKETPTKPAKKPTLSVAAQLEKAAVGCKKITGWVVRSKRGGEWDDDPDLPALEEIDEIEKREIEKAEVRKRE